MNAFVRISTKLLLACVWIAIVGCASPRQPKESIENTASNEGFFDLKQIPRQKLAQYSLDENKILEASKFVGLLIYETLIEGDEARFQNLKALNCSTDLDRKINSKFCIQVELRHCHSMCQMYVPRRWCSGVRVNNSFVSAKHCEPPAGFKPSVVFLDLSDKISRLKVKFVSSPSRVYDLSIFEFVEAPPTKSTLTVRASDPQIGEPVFGLGFPKLSVREGKTKQKDYLLSPANMRVTFGQVVEANLGSKSYCEYTNQDNVTDIEAWKLEQGCSTVDRSQLKFSAREEKDPFLTDSDMVWGMSGSPLFDQKGQLLGIGSNVLSNSPESYTLGKFAVYVKSKNLVGILQERSRNLR